MTNLTIANIFLFLRDPVHGAQRRRRSPLFFIYSIGATALAGAVRHQQLPHD